MAEDMVCAVRAQTAPALTAGRLGLGCGRRGLPALPAHRGSVPEAGRSLCRRIDPASRHHFSHGPRGQTGAARGDFCSHVHRRRAGGGAVYPGGGGAGRGRGQSRGSGVARFQAGSPIRRSRVAERPGGSRHRRRDHRFALPGARCGFAHVRHYERLGSGCRRDGGIWRTEKGTARETTGPAPWRRNACPGQRGYGEGGGNGDTRSGRSRGELERSRRPSAATCNSAVGSRRAYRRSCLIPEPVFGNGWAPGSSISSW